MKRCIDAPEPANVKKICKHDKLLDISHDLICGTILRRPSTKNKSPYVADVRLESGRETIVHVPSLDMGGKCVPGSRVMMKPARDRKGELIGPYKVSNKYNTPKCEFIVQLLYVKEAEFEGGENIWIGAHPKLGEDIAEALIDRGLLGLYLPHPCTYQREVSFPEFNMRTDFVIKSSEQVENSIKSVICEVKTVVDSDYAVGSAPDRLFVTSKDSIGYISTATPYARAAIFPVGKSRQRGPNNEKVISARAIKHIDELSQIADGTSLSKNGESFDAMMLFIVSRSDVCVFRPNRQACPTFASRLQKAKQAGVRLVAYRVRWGDGDDIGKCFADSIIPIQIE